MSKASDVMHAISDLIDEKVSEANSDVDDSCAGFGSFRAERKLTKMLRALTGEPPDKTDEEDDFF